MLRVYEYPLRGTLSIESLQDQQNKFFAAPFISAQILFLIDAVHLSGYMLASKISRKVYE